MLPPKNYELYLLSQCANCCIAVDKVKGTKSPIISSSSEDSTKEELSTIEVLSLMYGISTVKLTYNLVTHLKCILSPDDYNLMSRDLLSGSAEAAPVLPILGLCHDCASILEQMYSSHKTFHKKSHMRSFILKSLKNPEENNNWNSREMVESFHNPSYNESRQFGSNENSNYNFRSDEHTSNASFSFTNAENTVEGVSMSFAEPDGGEDVESNLSWESALGGHQNGIEMGESGTVGVNSEEVGGDFKEELETDGDTSLPHEDKDKSMQHHPQNHDNFDDATNSISFSVERNFENESLQHQCHRCKRQYCNQNELHVHNIRDHTVRISLKKLYVPPQTNIRCMFCGVLLLNNKEDLKKHERSLKTDGKRRLLACENSMERLSKIQFLNGKIYELEFDENDEQWEDYSIIPSHISGGPPFQCPKCSKDFKSKFAVKKHCKLEHKLVLPSYTLMQRGRCMDCNIRLTSQRCVTEHLRNVHGLIINNKTAIDNNSNRKSIRSKNLESACVISCSECSEGFNNTKILTKHCKFVHEMHFLCSKCFKCFAEMRLRDLHEYECGCTNECVETINSSSTIISAVTTPFPLEKFVESDAGASITPNTTTSPENNEFSSMPPVVIATGGVTTGVETGLDSDNIYCTKNREEVEKPAPFQCTKCERSYRTHSHLRQHCRRKHYLDLPRQIRSWNSIRTYCPECGIDFCDFLGLKNHFASMHNNRHYDCECCRLWFPRKSLLDLHLAKNQCEPLKRRDSDPTNKLFSIPHPGPSIVNTPPAVPMFPTTSSIISAEQMSETPLLPISGPNYFCRERYESTLPEPLSISTPHYFPRESNTPGLFPFSPPQYFCSESNEPGLLPFSAPQYFSREINESTVPGFLPISTPNYFCGKCNVTFPTLGFFNEHNEVYHKVNNVFPLMY